MKIKKGDNVLVISGKDARSNKIGKVMAVKPKENKIIVEGVNMITRHTKPRRQGEQGGRIKKEAPIDASNVMVVCSKCGKATRVGYKFSSDGLKFRVCKKCGESLDS
ncbi:MAG TPA: 50S ribosomal protein L24 [Clostridia bacterium]|nr:50S ribosomal protein L24 [Clostridia bacterium]